MSRHRMLPLAAALTLTGCSFLVNWDEFTGGGGGGPTRPEEGGSASDGSVHAPDASPADDADVDEDAPTLSRSCKEIRATGVTTDGVHAIDPDGPGSAKAVNVYCEMTTDGGGWMLVARSTTGASGVFGWRIARGSPDDDANPGMSSFAQSTSPRSRRARRRSPGP